MDENKQNGEVEQTEQKPVKSALTRKQMREHKQMYTPSSLRDNPDGKQLNIRAVFIIVISLIVACAIAIIIVVAVTSAKIKLRNETEIPVVSGDVSMQLEDSVYQYIDGTSVKIDAGAKLFIDENGNVVLKTAFGSNVTTLPVYIRGADGSRSVILTQDMYYYRARGEMGSIPTCAEKLTQITCDKNNVITAKRDGKTVTLDSGFLFDGEKTYIFLETVVVEYNGYQDEIPPMSFVEFVYGDKLQVFNYDTEKFEIQNCSEDGIAHSLTYGEVPPDWELQFVVRKMVIFDGTSTKNPSLFLKPAMNNHDFVKYLIPKD